MQDSYHELRERSLCTRIVLLCVRQTVSTETSSNAPTQVYSMTNFSPGDSTPGTSENESSSASSASGDESDVVTATSSEEDASSLLERELKWRAGVSANGSEWLWWKWCWCRPGVAGYLHAFALLMRRCCNMRPRPAWRVSERRRDANRSARRCMLHIDSLQF